MMADGRIIRVSFTAADRSLVAVVQDGESVSLRLGQGRRSGTVGSGLWRGGDLLHFQVDGELSSAMESIRSAAQAAIAAALASEAGPDPVPRWSGTSGDYRTRLQIAASRDPDMVGTPATAFMHELLGRMPIPVGMMLTSNELMALLGLVRRGLVRLQGEMWHDARPWQSESQASQQGERRD